MIRLAIRVGREHAELVLAELLELAPAGVEELDLSPDAVEYAVYGAPGELPSLPDLNAMVAGAVVDISTSEIPDDWHERWKQFHRPIFIPAPNAAAAIAPGAANTAPGASGGGVPALHVRPPWEAPSAHTADEVCEIVIDPGQAFGTGAHASTRMCLELLLELSAASTDRGPLLDVGTGSGVLAIAAAQLGFAPVLGLDHEQESVQATAENALVNGVQVEVRRFDLRKEPLPWLAQGAQNTPLTMLANLLRPLLLELAATMPAAPQDLIASGLLRAEADEVAGAFAASLGLRERKRRESGEWAALWLTAA